MLTCQRWGCKTMEGARHGGGGAGGGSGGSDRRRQEMERAQCQKDVTETGESQDGEEYARKAAEVKEARWWWWWKAWGRGG